MVERKQSQKPLWQKKIAEERIEILFAEAEKMAKRNELGFANRYVELARKIGMRYNVKIPKHVKDKFCRKCHSYLIPEKTCKIEHDKEKGIKKVKCFNCDRIIRILWK